MPKQLRYHIYPLWMWLVVIIFIVLSVYVVYLWQPTGVTPARPTDTLIALAPLLAIACFLVRLFFTFNGGTCGETLVILGLGVLLSMFLMPYIEAARSQVAWIKCRNDLKMIGVALHSYDDKFGSFPPVKRFNAEKNAAEDWQTILDENLGSQLDASDLEDTHEENEPNYYFAVVSENTAWSPDGKKIRLDDIADPANTAVAIGVLGRAPTSKLPRHDTKILLDDLLAGKISWKDQIAVYPYQYDRFSYCQPSANLLMGDGTLRHFVGVPSEEELRWLFDIRKKTPNTLPTDTSEGRVYFRENNQLQNTLPPPPSHRNPAHRTVFRIWQACLFMIIIAMFLPRKPRVPRVPREPHKTTIDTEPVALLEAEPESEFEALPELPPENGE